MSSRRVAVLVLDIVLLVSVVGFIVWQSARADNGSGESVPETAGAAGQAKTKAGRSAQARDVRRALEKLESDPESLVAKAARATVGDRARKAVPAGSTVTADRSTWNPDGAGGGTMAVKVTAPGRKPVTYAAIMVREPDGWKVLATVPVSGP